MLCEPWDASATRLRRVEPLDVPLGSARSRAMRLVQDAPLSYVCRAGSWAFRTWHRGDGEDDWDVQMFLWPAWFPPVSVPYAGVSLRAPLGGALDLMRRVASRNIEPAECRPWAAAWLRDREAADPAGAWAQQARSNLAMLDELLTINAIFEDAVFDVAARLAWGFRGTTRELLATARVLAGAADPGPGPRAPAISR